MENVLSKTLSGKIVLADFTRFTWMRCHCSNYFTVSGSPSATLKSCICETRIRFQRKNKNIFLCLPPVKNECTPFNRVTVYARVTRHRTRSWRRPYADEILSDMCFFVCKLNTHRTQLWPHVHSKIRSRHRHCRPFKSPSIVVRRCFPYVSECTPNGGVVCDSCICPAVQYFALSQVGALEKYEYVVCNTC